MRGSDSRHIPVLRCRTYFRHPNLRIRVLREVRQPPIPKHRHEFFEIVVVRAGSGVHFIGHDREPLQSGDVLVLNNRHIHGYESTHNLNLINILVRNRVVTHLDASLGNLPAYRALFTRGTATRKESPFKSHLHLAPADLRQCEQWAEQLDVEGWKDAEAATSLAEAYLTLLVSLLARRYSVNEPLPPPVSKFDAMCAKMESALDQPSRVVEMARMAGMSHRTVQRVFRRTFGISPSAYRARKRLQHAAELLRKRDNPSRISEIASECGFGDSNYFSRAFRRATGKSPRDYRKAHLKVAQESAVLGKKSELRSRPWIPPQTRI